MIGREVRQMAKRGRPPKDPFAKLAQARLNASSGQNLASALYKKLGVGGVDINQELIDGCKELIANYREGLGMGTLIPTDIFMAYGSLGGEHLTPEDEVIIKANYEAAVAKAKRDQARGAEGGMNKADARAQAVWGKDGKNKDLLRRIGNGSLSPNGAITKILDEWKTRGYDADDIELNTRSKSKKPSATSLSNWYKTLYPKK